MGCASWRALRSLSVAGVTVPSRCRCNSAAELHLHLEGTVTPATLKDLSARHDAHPMTRAESNAHYHFDDFTGFIEAFKAVTRRLISPDDYELVAWRMM